MNLSRAKEMLTQKNIPYKLIEYSCIGDFWNHISEFPCTQNTVQSKVITVVIDSHNKQKNLELQFNQSGNEFVFWELWFGGYAFEAFEYEPEILEQEILANIEEVMSGCVIAYSINDLKNKRWKGDGLLKKDGEWLEKFKQEMFKPKTWKEKIFRTQMQYELYDWDTYQVIVK